MAYSTTSKGFRAADRKKLAPGVTREVPETLEIKMFFHCRRCLAERPEGMSPGEYRQLDVGWTDLGIQVWCTRHNCNIVHIDFEGMTHPAAY